LASLRRVGSPVATEFQPCSAAVASVRRMRPLLLFSPAAPRVAGRRSIAAQRTVLARVTSRRVALDVPAARRRNVRPGAVQVAWIRHADRGRRPHEPGGAGSGYFAGSTPARPTRPAGGSALIAGTLDSIRLFPRLVFGPRGETGFDSRKGLGRMVQGRVIPTPNGFFLTGKNYSRCAYRLMSSQVVEWTIPGPRRRSPAG
jgi:hypothetical protein